MMKHYMQAPLQTSSVRCTPKQSVRASATMKSSIDMGASVTDSVAESSKLQLNGAQSTKLLTKWDREASSSLIGLVKSKEPAKQTRKSFAITTKHGLLNSQKQLQTGAASSSIGNSQS